MRYRNNEAGRLEKKYSSATHYVLSSLIPYTESNLKLTFAPSRFFRDLDKLDFAKEKSLQNAYYRAVRRELIEIDDQGIPRLTTKGLKKLNFFEPKLLGKNARLLLIFDIPEGERWKRDRLRIVLREFSFKQVQKSVWETEYDCREYLHAEIKNNQLQDYVVLYEAARKNI